MTEEKLFATIQQKEQEKIENKLEEKAERCLDDWNLF